MATKNVKIYGYEQRKGIWLRKTVKIRWLRKMVDYIATKNGQLYSYEEREQFTATKNRKIYSYERRKHI